MKYQFVDTVAIFTVDGKDFTLDVGVEKAEKLGAVCFGDGNIESIKGAVAALFGREAADSMFAGIPAGNDIKARHLGLSLSRGIATSRAGMVMSAFNMESKAGGAPAEGGAAE